jgi:hypothetical protein
VIVVDSNFIAYLYLPTEFGALAKRLDMPLVSADKKILDQFPGIARSLTQALG